MRAIADKIEERLSEAKVRMLGREGYDDARWILLDYCDLVVHIFDEETRAYYDLERLWGDATRVQLTE